MAESRDGLDGRPTDGWKAGDPPPGYYMLKLHCGFCGANNGFLWPEAGAPPLGTLYVAPPGTSGAGVCQRCGKSNRCTVASAPKKGQPKEVDPWSY